MDIVSALVGVHGLEVHDVPDDMILVRDAVAAMHVPCHTSYFQSLTAVISFHHRDVLDRAIIIIHQTAYSKRALQTQCTFPLHIGELSLDELVRGQGTTKLFSF